MLWSLIVRNGGVSNTPPKVMAYPSTMQSLYKMGITISENKNKKSAVLSFLKTKIDSYTIYRQSNISSVSDGSRGRKIGKMQFYPITAILHIHLTWLSATLYANKLTNISTSQIG